MWVGSFYQRVPSSLRHTAAEPSSFWFYDLLFNQNIVYHLVSEQQLATICGRRRSAAGASDMDSVATCRAFYTPYFQGISPPACCLAVMVRPLPSYIPLHLMTVSG